VLVLASAGLTIFRKHPVKGMYLRSRFFFELESLILAQNERWRRA
jgi:hypothetical protein